VELLDAVPPETVDRPRHAAGLEFRVRSGEGVFAAAGREEGGFHLRLRERLRYAGGAGSRFPAPLSADLGGIPRPRFPPRFGRRDQRRERDPRRERGGGAGETRGTCARALNRA